MHAAPETKVHVTRHEQTCVLTVRGEVDHDDAEDFEAAWEAADRAALPVTAVDLSQVSFADSMLLNALLGARRRHLADGRDLVVLGPLQPAVRRLLTISGTIDHFHVVDAGHGHSHGHVDGTTP
ncbi:anti-anti-sigma factor [Streptomyces sp. 2231.1]|uniref:STAS domain-containing protein n=1 Tax=Streptomyces sp. 2231.1 TaxID=1855347 RepID=UPI000896CA73|nr:STAS domain-containing protein [Streptomyces sp. 2231.1]SEE28778.1 anti-anti-sigma factor [Streptomyces sp. 2231.1]